MMTDEERQELHDAWTNLKVEVTKAWMGTWAFRNAWWIVCVYCTVVVIIMIASVLINGLPEIQPHR